MAKIAVLVTIPFNSQTGVVISHVQLSNKLLAKKKRNLSLDINLMCRFALIAHTHMNTNMVIHDDLTTNAGDFILKTKPNFF